MENFFFERIAKITQVSDRIPVQLFVDHPLVVKIFDIFTKGFEYLPAFGLIFLAGAGIILPTEQAERLKQRGTKTWHPTNLTTLRHRTRHPTKNLFSSR